MIRFRHVIGIIGAFLFSIPSFAFAAGITTIVPQPAAGQEACPLGYQAILTVVQNITNDAIYLAGIFAVLLIAYAGFLFATNATSPSNLEKGRNVLISTVIGFVIVISAWLIVNEVIVTFTTGSLQSVTSLLESHSSSQCLPVVKPKTTAKVEVVHSSKKTTGKATVKVVHPSTSKKTTTKVFDAVKEADAFLLRESNITFAKGGVPQAINQSLKSLAVTDLKEFCVTYSQKVPFFSSGVETQGTCTQADATQALDYLSTRLKPFLRTQITTVSGETTSQILAAEQAYALKSIGLQVVTGAIKSGSISGGL